MVRVFSFSFRNQKTGNLCFRVAGPKHLGPAVGRSEINKSFRTADKSIAIPQAMRLSADCQVQFKLLNDDTYLNVCWEAESKDYP